MPKLTYLCGTAIVGMTVLCAGCPTTQPVQAPSFPLPVAAPTAWVKNAAISAVPVPETDESQLLDLDMWRFDITAPKTKHEIRFIVEVQEIGKPTQTLVSLPMQPQSGWPMNNHLSVFVGQVPLYNGLEMDSKARYKVRTGSFKSAPLQEMGGNSISAIADNPLNGLVSSGSSGTPQQRQDGSFILSYGYRHDFPRQPQEVPEVAVVFRVEEEAY